MISKNRSRFTHGVVHSFTGDMDEMLKLVELGLFIGVSGVRVRIPFPLMCNSDSLFVNQA